jgi:8-amino-7-oxononanoate synthase
MKQNKSAVLHELEDLSRRGLRRTLRLIESPQDAYVQADGQRLCNFGSNNYLGLANHPLIRKAVTEAVEKWGWGSGASRLVTGHMGAHQQLEQRLAAFRQTEAALVCPTGYQTNLAAIRPLVARQDVIFLDKLNHASIIDAARGSEAIVRVFGHRDYDKLERLLQRYSHAPRRLIVTDSLFSMNGDFADLPRLVELKNKYDAWLCVDEAHASGVFGTNGRGLTEHVNVEQDIDICMGTLSKAFGGIGGYIAASQDVIDWIINTAGPFIYTTAIPPAACAAAMTALDLIAEEPQRREHLLKLAEYCRNVLTSRGWNLADSCSQIIPVIVGENEEVLRLSEKLKAADLLVPAIRPPTVRKGHARLRISLTAAHSMQDIEKLLSALGTKS